MAQTVSDNYFYIDVYITMHSIVLLLTAYMIVTLH